MKIKQFFLAKIFFSQFTKKECTHTKVFFFSVKSSLTAVYCNKMHKTHIFSSQNHLTKTIECIECYIYINAHYT